ncbi:phosphotransferase [Marinomonas pollencensis]|uniref:Thiamine kinase-like enzyme n=1 Tax=Marinomonas pollencensis TaxID=491954 RepID=A0A3E0DJF4_9GAMM|nr:phosphotransferase [Marinomonas pollencensis]REG82839.1 thiamine kinase-like enzyme [Marinomonas pollencensis]
MVNLSGYLDKIVVALPQNSTITAIPLEEGFSNHVYRLDWEGKAQWVLRIPGLDESAFCIDRQSELQVMNMAAQAGLSPKLVWQDKMGAFACRFVTPPSFPWTVSHCDKNIIRIKELLLKTHQLPAVERVFCIYKLIEHYLTGIADRLLAKPELNQEYDYLHSQFDVLQRVIPNHALVLCHNDLNPKNILMDDEAAWLIDWEYAGMGDPLFDLAVVARSHNLTASQRQRLLAAYHPELDLADSEWRILQYGLAYALREMTWLLLKHLTTPEDPQGLARYQEFKAAPWLNPFFSQNP